MTTFGPTYRSMAILALGLTMAATSSRATEVYSGPNPALAPGQDRYPAGMSTPPHTVYYDQDGAPYVLHGRQEKQFLAGYNVTWIDKNHVLLPQGVGGTD